MKKSLVVGLCLGLLAAFALACTAAEKGFEEGTKEKEVGPQQTQPPPKQWVTVLEVSGDSDKRTDTFELKGGKAKLTYNVTGDMVVAAIYVLKEGQSLEKSGGFPEVTVSKAGSDTTFLVKDAGKYYLDIKSANASWTIKIEEER